MNLKLQGREVIQVVQNSFLTLTTASLQNVLNVQSNLAIWISAAALFRLVNILKCLSPNTTILLVMSFSTNCSGKKLAITAQVTSTLQVILTSSPFKRSLMQLIGSYIKQSNFKMSETISEFSCLKEKLILLITH